MVARTAAVALEPAVVEQGAPPQAAAPSEAEARILEALLGEGETAESVAVPRLAGVVLATAA